MNARVSKHDPSGIEYRHLDEVDGSLHAAEATVPLVLVTGPVSSVVDVGGGTGG